MNVEFDVEFLKRIEAAVPGDKPLEARIEELVRRYVAQTELSTFKQQVEAEAKSATDAQIAARAQILSEELKL